MMIFGIPGCFFIFVSFDELSHCWEIPYPWPEIVWNPRVSMETLRSRPFSGAVRWFSPRQPAFPWLATATAYEQEDVLKEGGESWKVQRWFLKLLGHICIYREILTFLWKKMSRMKKADFEVVFFEKNNLTGFPDSALFFFFCELTGAVAANAGEGRDYAGMSLLEVRIKG